MKDVIVFTRGSAKRAEIFNNLKRYEDEEFLTPPQNYILLRPFCPTRRVQRISSLKTIDANYETVLQFLNGISTSKNENREVKAKASGYLKFLKFETVLFLELVIVIFEKIQILNTTLQTSGLNFSTVTEKRDLIKAALNSDRDNGFSALWNPVLEKTKTLEIEVPSLNNVRKQESIQANMKNGIGSPHYHRTTEDKCGTLYNEII